MFKSDSTKLYQDRLKGNSPDAPASILEPDKLSVSRKERAVRLVPNPKEDYRLLDIGSGPGGLLDALVKGLKPPSEYVGVDPVPEFIEAGKAKYPHANWHLATLETLPEDVTDDWFQLIACLGVTPHLEQNPGALSKFAYLLAQLHPDRILLSWHDKTYGGKFSAFDTATVLRVFAHEGYGSATLATDTQDTMVVGLFIYDGF